MSSDKTYRLSRFFLIFFMYIFLFLRYCFAWELESKYFKADIDKAIDTRQLVEKLKVDYFLRLGNNSGTGYYNPENLLKDGFDALYLEVSDILDIHMYDFQITLKIVNDKKYLSEIIQKYNIETPESVSFYHWEKNMIYISWDEFDICVLAHEIAHAIISHYFVVPPSQKIQEVLSGYVDYSIRKSLNKVKTPSP